MRCFASTALLLLPVLQSCVTDVRHVEQTAHRTTGIHFLAKAGGAIRIEKLLSVSPGLADGRDVEGYTALHYAVEKNRIEATRVLLEMGADPAARGTHNHRTPLFFAARDGYSECARLLVEKGVPPEERRHALRLAVQGVRAGHMRIVEYLLGLGVEPDIFAAVKLGMTDRVRGVLGSDPKAVHSRDGNERTPLHWAARSGNLAAVRVLLDSGAEVDACSYHIHVRRTPLHEACGSGRFNVVREMLRKGADPDAVACFGVTPMGMAAPGREADHTRIVRLLLDKGVPADRPCGFDNYPLHNAAFCGNLTTVRLLVERGATISKENSRGETALDVARRQRASGVVRFLENPVLDKPTQVPAKGT